MSNRPHISLVMTVRNEANALPRLLDSLSAQTVRPDEVVIVDGGSTDGTQEVIRAYAGRLPMPVRLIEQPGANIAEGRNRAISEAAHDIVAVTDAGVRLDLRWLEELSELLSNPDVDVVSGFFMSDPKTHFELAMGATVLPDVEEIKPKTFLPSSRSIAFRKSVWEEIGGYPEWLDYCEDLVFDMRLKEAGCRFVFAPQAVVYFRPRSTLRAFFHQYFRYARGDGKADLWRKRHAIRYATYSVGPLVALCGWRHRRSLPGKLTLAAGGLAAFGYCRRPYTRLFPTLRDLPLSSALYALALVPLIRLTGDIAKMLGYPVGVLWRIKHRRRL
ncbi:MAG TPA: glycosyltransferase [Chloroflexia bacterium]|nr:glycosyltransferase [Chloroflexia bacterium]